jgi:5-methylcytosine-specific restriction endonuclease McrA
MTLDQLREAARTAARNYQDAERELCDLLTTIDECRLWQTWGYSSLVHYAEEELRLSHRKALDLVRVNASLKALPALDRAFREDGVPFSKVREATRVATPGTDADWARKVQDGSYRDVEQEVYGARRAAAHSVRLDLSGEEYDRFEQAIEAVRRHLGRRVDLAACLDQLASSYLARDTAGDGSSRFPDGSSSTPFTQVVYRCESCERASVQTRRGLVSVSPRTREMAACDSMVIREGQRTRRSVPRAMAQAVWSRARGRCERCGQRGWLHLHHRRPVSEGGAHEVDNLRLLCSACHAAEHEPGVSSEAARARASHARGASGGHGGEVGRIARLGDLSETARPGDPSETARPGDLSETARSDDAADRCRPLAHTRAGTVAAPESRSCRAECAPSREASGGPPGRQSHSSIPARV